MNTVKDMLNRTDWTMFAAQKEALVDALFRLDEISVHAPQTDSLNGLLRWLDSIQAAACVDGWPSYPQAK